MKVAYKNLIISTGICFLFVIIMSITFQLVAEQQEKNKRVYTVDNHTTIPTPLTLVKDTEGINTFFKDKNNGRQAENHSHTMSNPIPLTVTATAYTSRCEGCSGITYMGTDVRNTIYHESGLRIVAVDPKVIPLGSIVEIDGKKFIADDIGGAIKGNRIDILVSTHDSSIAFEYGKQKKEILVYLKKEDKK